MAIVDKRWTFMSRPIHAMAALLHPFYKKPTLFNDTSLLKGKDAYIGCICEEDEQLDIDAEIASFENNLGPSFTRAVALRPEATKFSLTWWQSYGRQGLPKLTRIALRVLSQVKFAIFTFSIHVSLCYGPGHVPLSNVTMSIVYVI